MVTKLMDYSTWRPDVEEIKKLGASGVVRYLSVVNEKTTPKIITKDGADRLLAGGLSISLVYEWHIDRAGEGHSAGAFDVALAEEQADDLGAPLEIPIFYAVDKETFDVEDVREYFKAINETNRRPVGVYGKYSIVHGLMKEGLAEYGWQTSAWSDGKICSHAHLYQNVFKTNYDMNDVRKPFPLWIKTAAEDEPDVEEPVDSEVEKPTEVFKPERGDKDTWLRVNAFGAKVAIGGYWITTRTLNMYLEACRLFRHFGGGTPPTITQGGRNAGGVKQSAGTHDREALDWATKSLSSSQEDLWELCLWVVGFASWQRPYVAGPNGWIQHTHGLPKQGDLSRGAASQIVDFSVGRDGLAANASYPRISTLGVWNWTWENYLSTFAIDSDKLKSDIKNRTKSVEVLRLQWALSAILRKDVVGDGDPGPKTLEALGRYAALSSDILLQLGLTPPNVIVIDEPPPVKWPKITGEEIASMYYVDPKKVETHLNGRDVNGEIVKERPPYFEISTAEAIAVGGETNPSTEGDNRWIKTKANVYYDLDYLTVEKPVTTKTIKFATWNLYVGNNVANSKAGLEAIMAEGVCCIGVQELSEDAEQKALTAFMESKGWKATKRNSAVTSFYDPRVLENIKESHIVVEKGGRPWESGAGGNDSIYKIIMMIDGTIKGDGRNVSLLNHHPVPTVESNGKFRADKPIRVEIYKKQIAAMQEQVKKRSGLVFVTADQNVAWGTSAGDWVMKEYDKVDLTVCWDEAPDQSTHTSNRCIDWGAVKGGTVVGVQVLPSFKSDHHPVVVTVSY